MARERVNLSLSRQELAAVDRLLRATPWRFKKRSSAMKDLLVYLSNNIDGIRALVTGGLPVGNQPEPEFQLRSPGTEVALQSTQKEEKKKEEKKERRLAPLDLSQRILDDLNKRAGSNFQARGKVARQNIAARLAEGYTEADFYEVHRKMCVLWLGTDMAQHLTYETLYGNKFTKYLGQPEPRPSRQIDMIMEPEDEVPPAEGDEE
jgi:uncharacterized phage protein (TIGR02220 family)